MKKLLSLFLPLLLFLGASAQYTTVTDIKFTRTEVNEIQPLSPSPMQMFDGLLVQSPVVFGPGNWIPLKADMVKEETPIIRLYPQPQWDMILDTFWVYRISGDPITSPTEVWAKKRGGLKVKMCQYDGSWGTGWHGFPIADSNRVPIDSIQIIGGIANFATQFKGLGDVWGSEWRFSGRIKLGPPRASVTPPLAYIGGTHGENTFWWDVTQDNTTGIDAMHEVLPKTTLLSDMGMKFARFYQRVRYLQTGVDTFSFNPTANRWMADSSYAALKRRGVESILTIMGMQLHLEQTWPDDDSALVHQDAHGFVVGEAVRKIFTGDGETGFTWYRCNATLPAPSFNFLADFPSWLDAIVVRVIDANHFETGEVGNKFNTGNPLGLTPNATYYMSAATSGTSNYGPANTPAPSGNAFVPLFTTDASGEATVIRSTNPGFEARENPVSYANRDNRENPASYVDQARLYFVLTATYGRNTLIADSLMGVRYDFNEPFLPNDYIKKGLDLVNIVEPLNEVELDFWSGPLRHYFYMDGRKMAAFLSAIYDADQGRLHWKNWPNGVGLGVKNADSTMKVLAPGLSNPNAGFVIGMIEWCREHRGYKANGEVDIPFDIINFHSYSIDAGTQYGTVTTGMCPELSGTVDRAAEFQRISKYWAYGKKYYCTEYGWDYHDSSRFRAPAFGPYSKYEVAGLWDIRTRLLYAKYGVHGMTYFKAYCDDSLNATQFASMAVIKMSYTNNYQKYPIADFMVQDKIYSRYVWDSTYRNDTLHVERFRIPGTDTCMIAIWSHEDTIPLFNKIVFDPGSGFPPVTSKSFIERTGTYALPLPSNPSVKRRTLVVEANSMSVADDGASGGFLNVNYSSKPVFVELLVQQELPQVRILSSKIKKGSKKPRYDGKL